MQSSDYKAVIAKPRTCDRAHLHREAVLELQEAGVIQEVSGRKSGRQYLARAVLKVIEGPGDA